MILLITYPLITALIISIYGYKIGMKGVEIITKINIVITMIIMSKYIKEYILYNKIIRLDLNWINIGIYNIKYNIMIDRYTIYMIILINIISSIVIIYSFWYMKEENNRNRFIIYLLLFSVSMLLLVLSSNFLLMFIGWEYVGIISFLLINYWYINSNNNKSAFKALILNKIGDLFFIIFFSFLILSNLNLSFFNLSFHFSPSFFFFFFLAAIAKSAQLFFHVWLGDAMAGPTPVSALLHAATMVTAGIYILIRSNIYNINNYIIYISLFTIILGGFAALNQYDIKKIIAYSTVSQLGYMLYSIGINNKEFAFFHLITHGFFKALLFLSAGIIIHNYYNEQDIRKYGNLIYFAPRSYIFFIYGTLSLISFPYFSGYYSKELILYNSYNNNLFISSLLYLGVLFTLLYSLNLIYHLFFKHNKLSPFIETIPKYFIILFIPLLFGSLFLGFFLFDALLSDSLFSINLFHFLPSYIHYIPSFFLFISFIILYLYNLSFPGIISSKIHIILNRRFFIDTLYNYISIYFLYFSSYFFFKYIDKGFLEYFGPIGLYRFIRNTHTSQITIFYIITLFFILLTFLTTIFFIII